MTGAAWRAAPFCPFCGAPHPWATREERLRHDLGILLDSQDLTEAERLDIRAQIAMLFEPTDEATDDRKVRAGQRLKAIAPGFWMIAQPILRDLLTAEVKRRLGLT